MWQFSGKMSPHLRMQAVHNCIMNFLGDNGRNIAHLEAFIEFYGNVEDPSTDDLQKLDSKEFSAMNSASKTLKQANLTENLTALQKVVEEN